MAKRADPGAALAGDGRPIVGTIDAASLWLFASRIRRTFWNWRTVLLRLVLSSLGAKGGEITTRARTGALVVSPAARAAWWPVYEMLAEDLYRLNEIHGLRLKKGDVILDVGAHLGAAAVALARRFPDAHIVCVEPNPLAFSYLERNLSANRLLATARNRAAGARDGSALLRGTDDASCEASTTFERPGESLEVPVVSFSRLVAEAPGPVRIVKLDCEGAEHEIVTESDGRAWADVELVLLEYHPSPGAGGGFGELRERFFELGFDLDWEVAFSWRPGLGMAGLRRRPGQRRR